MTLYEMMCILGIPAIFAGVLKIAFNQIRGIKLGVKAQLRAQMISEFNIWEGRGYAPIYARQNFQNLWEQYHAIKGPNGVIDDIHDRFLDLPTEPPKEEK
jgi:hypothetical protein